MKLFKLIVIIMVIVLAGGVVVSLIGRNEKTDEKLLVDIEEPEFCVYNFSTGAMSATDDPNGKGYEYFACEDCGNLKKVVANHESGHYFRTLADGSKFCACGATLEIEEKKIGKNYFSSKSEALIIDHMELGDYLVDLNDDGTDDVFDVSLRNGQFFLRPNSNSMFETLLMGCDDVGNVIDTMRVTFKFWYTGTFEPTGSWTGNVNNTYVFLNYQFETRVFASLYFEPIDGKIKAYGEVGTENYVVLSPDVEYTFNLEVDVVGKRLVLTVEGGDISSPKVMFDLKSEQPPLTDLFQIGIGRETFYCSDGRYGLYMDDLELGCSLFTVNDEKVNDAGYCDHDFKAKRIIDYDHPASELWKKYTCKECGCWYYGH